MKPREDKWVLCGEKHVIRVTDKAILVEPGNEWVPKTQLHPTENECNNLNDRGMLVVSEWIAREKGWL